MPVMIFHILLIAPRYMTKLYNLHYQSNRSAVCRWRQAGTLGGRHISARTLRPE